MHLLVPLLPAVTLYRQKWLKSYLLMMTGMLIDLDHLLATPVYDPGRCSIGFHPLHTLLPVLIYVCVLVYPRTRIVGLGLCIHVVLDSIDCFNTNGIWFTAG